MEGLDEKELRCSFCGQHQTQVAKIIAGPGVYICNQCVQLCNEVLTSVGAAPTTGAPPWDTLGDDQVLGLLPNFANASAQVERDLQECVDRLRRRGVTWARIGESLGTSRQAAWARFSGEE